MNHLLYKASHLPPRFLSASAHWRAIFGRKALKIPLDAGFSCPNRDGTLATGGCSFCDAHGSGTGLRSLSLAGQWRYWKGRRNEKWGDVALIAYLQSFSNTHGPLEKLERVLTGLTSLEGLQGLCLGTRPDCLDQAKLHLLAQFPTQELWLELGLQSSNPATLARVNRGHTPQCFADAVHAAASLNIKVLAHVMAGLPGETPSDWLATTDFINRLPISGVKFHNLYISHGAPLARDYIEGRFTPPTLPQYAAWVADSIARLRPDIVVHRLVADPSPNDLLAPAWAGDKRLMLDAIESALAGRAAPEEAPPPLDSSAKGLRPLETRITSRDSLVIDAKQLCPLETHIASRSSPSYRRCKRPGPQTPAFSMVASASSSLIGVAQPQSPRPQYSSIPSSHAGVTQPRVEGVSGPAEAITAPREARRRLA